MANGSNDIKQHKWFECIDWCKIYNRSLEAPFVPDIKSAGDTSNFDEYDEEPLKISKNLKFSKEFVEF